MGRNPLHHRFKSIQRHGENDDIRLFDRFRIRRRFLNTVMVKNKYNA